MALPLPAQDSELVTLARRGRDDAFGALYERYFDGVYDFLTRLLRDRQEAADVAQDTFIKAFERLGHLEKPESFKSWLFTIAHRNGLNRIERSKRAVAVGDFYVSDREAGALGVIDPDRAGDPERSAEAMAAASIIWEAAAGLDPKTYSVMDLHVRHGLDSAEIAEVLGVSKGNAYTMVSRMKKSFSATLATYLLVRQGSADCDVLGAIVAAETATGLTPELRRSVDRHTKSCDKCQENRKVLFLPLKMFAALGAVPVPAGLKATIWGSVKAAAVGGGAAKAAAGSEAAPVAATGAAGGGAMAWVRSNLSGLAAAAVLIAVLFVGGAALLGDRGDDGETEVLSSGVTSTSIVELVTPSTDPTLEPTPPRESTTTEPPSSTAAPTTLTPTTVAPPVEETTTTTTTTTVTPTTTVVPPTTTVLPPPLVVRGDTVILDEDTSALIDVLANDSGFAPGAAPQVATAPLHGSARTSGSSILYSPDANFAGADVLTYEVAGRDGSTRRAQVSLTVTAINDAPTVPGPGQLSLDEDGTVRFDPLEGAVDVDGDALTMTTFDTTSAHGGSVTSGSLIYSPASNWSGSDSFTYRVSDGTVEVVVAVSLTVAAVNDPPTGPAPHIDAAEDSATTAQLLEGWDDVEGDTVYIADPGTRTTDRGGTAVVAADGEVVYTPPADYSGADGFTVRISDGTATMTVAVSVNVSSSNDAPIITAREFSAREDLAVGAVIGVVTATDPEGDEVSFESGSNSVFTIRPDGTLVLVSNLDYEADDRHVLEAEAVDDRGARTAFTVVLTVIDVNEGPVVNSATFRASAGDPAGTVLGRVSASDPEDDTLTFSLQNGGGLLAIDSATGAVRLLVDADPDDFPHTAIAIAKDPAGNSGGASITVVIDDVDGPVITNFRSDVDSFYEPPPEGGVCPSRPRSAKLTANVSDPSGVRGADLVWRINVGGLVSSGSVKMVQVDGQFEVRFSAPPGVLWNRDPTPMYLKVRARDDFNTFAESPEISVTVLPCDVD